MRKGISVLAVAIICTTVSYESSAQKSFAGTVRFEVKFEGDIDPQKHGPSEPIVYTIFENKEKTSLYNGVIQTIKDGDALTETNLVDWPGYARIGHTASKESKQKDLSRKKYSYVERADTKNICGYECKGYDVTLVIKDEDDDDDEEGEETKYIVYTTKEIGKDDNINALDHPGLSGYPLYMEFEKDGVKTIIQAKEVKKGKIKAVDFLIPSDYKMCSDEEFQEEFMKRVQGQ